MLSIALFMPSLLVSQKLVMVVVIMVSPTVALSTPTLIETIFLLATSDAVLGRSAVNGTTLVIHFLFPRSSW